MFVVPTSALHIYQCDGTVWGAHLCVYTNFGMGAVCGAHLCMYTNSGMGAVCGAPLCMYSIPIVGWGVGRYGFPPFKWPAVHTRTYL